MDPYDLDPDDRALFYYVRGEGPVPTSYRDSLVSRYPLRGSKEVFRGLRFDTEEKLQEFLSKIQNGIISSDSLTSWSPHIETAFQFATTVPAFNITRQLAKLISDNPGEILLGEGGVILRTVLKEGIDVTKTRYAAENEILALPGKMRVEVVKVIRRFRDMLHGKDVNEVIRGLIEDNEWEDLIRRGQNIEGYETGGLFQYIANMHESELNSDTRYLMGQVWSNRDKIGKPYVVKSVTQWDGGVEVQVHLSTMLGLVAAGFFGTPSDVRSDPRIRKFTKPIGDLVDDTIETIKAHPNSHLTFYGQGSLHGLTKYASPAIQKRYKEGLQDTFGARYQTLNQPGVKTRKEIDEIANEMTRLLKSISSSVRRVVLDHVQRS